MIPNLLLMYQVIAAFPQDLLFAFLSIWFSGRSLAHGRTWMLVYLIIECIPVRCIIINGPPYLETLQTEPQRMTRRKESPLLPCDHTPTVAGTSVSTFGGTSFRKASQGGAHQGDPRYSSESSHIYFCSLDMYLSLVNLVQHVYLRGNVALKECTRQ